MTDILREVVLPRLDGVRKQAGYWMAKCPAHEDSRASLSVSPGKEHPVLFTCHAGCDVAVILDRLGLSWTDLCSSREPEQGEWTPFGPADAVYDYCDEAGDLLFQVLRAPGKRFVQRRPDPAKKSGWAYQLDGVRRVPYRLPKVIEGVSEGTVIYIPEGEKDVHSLEAAGQVATCNPGGAGKWRDEYSVMLRDAIVIIIADRDDPGHAHARQVAASLAGVAGAVEICEAAEGKDVTDHLNAGRELADLVMIWQDGDPAPDLAPALSVFVSEPDPPQVFALGDLLELGDRLMLTGMEGYGKSTLLRQLTVCAAAGLHPFHFHDIEPRRVLAVDCENRERQLRREYRPLVRKAEQTGHPLKDDMFRLIVRPQGIDLSTEDGRAWLLERVTAHKPEILAIGSLWHMHTGDLNKEENARVVIEAVNEAVNKAGCAVMIECHAPKGDGKIRPWWPSGSRLFMAWPDIGFGLIPEWKKGADPDAEPARFRLRRWRGTRDRGQRWPVRLIPGIPGGWPWIAEPEQDAWR
jgi:hypothetical protein